MHHYPEEELISRLQNQDKTAITQLYDQYSASLYGVILRIVKDKEMAEEVLQDCFVKIWSSFPNYDSSKGRLYTWLITLTRHVAIDKCRSRSYREGRLNQDLEVLYDNKGFASCSFIPEHIGIKELTVTLSSNQKRVIDLLYFEGYSQIEAAKVLGIPLATVKTRARQALQLLRKLIVKPVVIAA